jgi:hypothetical protein
MPGALLSANIAPQKLFSYDPVGNLLSKTDVGAYTYPLAGSALPHAVKAVAGTINSTFTYDPTVTRPRGLGAASPTPPTTSRPRSPRARARRTSPTT